MQAELGTRYAAPDPSGPPELDIAGMIAALKAAGYSVTKRRARTSYDARGFEVDTRRCIHCGDPAAHATRVGARKVRDRHAVGLCAPCYRFGPRMSGVPLVPADPEYARRLFATWRRAHHRYARRHAAGLDRLDTGRTEQYVVRYGVRENMSDERPIYWQPIREAEALADAIKKAMTNQKMERRFDVYREAREEIAA